MAHLCTLRPLREPILFTERMVQMGMKEWVTPGLPALDLSGEKADKRLESAKDVLSFVKSEKLAIAELKFVDLPGMWQHFSLPASVLEEDLFGDGIGFDGSSVRGHQAI